MENVNTAQKTARIEALTDGVYAIIMTLLAFDIRLPEVELSGISQALASLGSTLVTYVISFALLGVYWTGHRNQFNYIERIDQTLRWISIFFLGVSALIPFTAEMLSRYPLSSLPIMLYGVNLIVIGLLLFWHWSYATGRGKLVADDLAKEVIYIGKERSLFAVVCYLAAIALAFFVPVLSLIIYALVPLFYIFPKLWSFIPSRASNGK